jgi:serine protease Do
VKRLVAASWVAAVSVVATAAAVATAACGPKSDGKTTTPVAPLTPAQIAERALPSVVLIKFPDAVGTGFVVWKDGRIATNLHVLLMGQGQPITVVLPDGREFNQRQVEVLAADPEHDLAVIRVTARDLQPLALADSDKVKPGEAVVAIGHPLGLGNTVSDGLVSAIQKLDEDHTLLQVSAPISPGSSGGPLINDRGEVIGVATLYASEGQNINFGVPANHLKPLLLRDKGVEMAHLQRWLDELILASCAPENVLGAAQLITDAIKVGAPMYNSRNHEGCYQVYAGTAEKLIKELPDCPGVKKLLKLGLKQAATAPDASARAWAMRHAFDAFLDAVGKALQGP